MGKFWDIYKYCGSRDCGHMAMPIALFDMEKRILIQVRELRKLEFLARSPQVIRRTFQRYMPMSFYYHYYRSTLIVLRKQDQDTVLPSFIIRESGRVVGNSIFELEVKELSISDVMGVFDSRPKQNRSLSVNLEFTAIYFPDGMDSDSIGLETCTDVSLFTILSNMIQEPDTHSFRAFNMNLSPPPKLVTPTVTNQSGWQFPSRGKLGSSRNCLSISQSNCHSP